MPWRQPGPKRFTVGDQRKTRDFEQARPQQRHWRQNLLQLLRQLSYRQRQRTIHPQFSGQYYLGQARTGFSKWRIWHAANGLIDNGRHMLDVVSELNEHNLTRANQEVGRASVETIRSTSKVSPVPRLHMQLAPSKHAVTKGWDSQFRKRRILGLGTPNQADIQRTRC
jgi:hypothetical protein